MNTGFYLAAFAALALAAQPAAAESAGGNSVLAFQERHASEMRATVGITIPFGGQRNQAASQPRLNIGFDHRAERHDTLLSVNPVRNFEEPEWRRTSFALTLERTPRVMLNGVQMAQFNSSLHADETDEESESDADGGPSTALIVGGVLVGGLLALAVAGTADLVDAVEDLGDPD